MSNSPTLYHYCSAQTFSAIVEKRMLRLSDSRLMNDEMEGKWARKLLLDGLKRSLSQNIYHEYLQAVSDFETPSALLFCLSVNGDLLSQWRSYADDGFGFSIGFNIGIDGLLPPAADAKLFPVDYEIQEGHVSALVFGIENIIRREGPKSDKARIAFHFRDSNFLLKNPAFREEQEYRLVQRNMDLVTGFHAKREGIFSYAEYPLIPGPYGEQSIHRVYLGPKNRTPIDTVQKMMQPFGNVEILRSAATYR